MGDLAFEYKAMIWIAVIFVVTASLVAYQNNEVNLTGRAVQYTIELPKPVLTIGERMDLLEQRVDLLEAKVKALENKK